MCVIDRARKLFGNIMTEKYTKRAGDFYSHHLVDYERDCAFAARSALTIRVLGVLEGKPWDDLALAFVHGLRPSAIRVTKGEVTLDSWQGRVTVVVDDNNIIESIEQEVEVGLPEGVAHGQALRVALKYGINSPQCQWYNDENIKGYVCTSEGYFKRSGGELVPFPKD